MVWGLRLSQPWPTCPPGARSPSPKSLGTTPTSSAKTHFGTALESRPLRSWRCLESGLKSEEKVSGYHADNVAPAIVGGFVLIRSYEPLEMVRLSFPEEKELFFVLTSPELEAPTKKMRAALPTEPRRAPLIPGMEGVKRAAIEAGAFRCTISGAGPTAVAVIDDVERGAKIGEQMVKAFLKEGNLKSVATVHRLDRAGGSISRWNEEEM